MRLPRQRQNPKNNQEKDPPKNPPKKPNKKPLKKTQTITKLKRKENILLIKKNKKHIYFIMAYIYMYISFIYSSAYNIIVLHDIFW